MDCKDVRADLEAFALGALDPASEAEIRAHLAACPECAEIERGYRRAIEHLALDVPVYRAPPRLKRMVIGGAAGERDAWARPIATRWWAAAAAALLLFALGSVAWAVVLSGRVNELEAQNARMGEGQLDDQAKSAIQRMQNELASTKSQQKELLAALEEQATLIALALDSELIPSQLQGTTLAPDASCRYVWSSEQRLGALTCRNLPVQNSGLTYQLWVTRSDRTIALGEFVPRNDGSAYALVKFPTDIPGPNTAMWVTLEVASNTLTKPSTDVILERVPAPQASR